MNQPVAITGVGMLSSLGPNAETTWQAVQAGKCGADSIGFLTGSDWPVCIGHEVKSWPKPGIHASHTGPCLPLQFGLKAATEAIAQAGLTDHFDALGSRAGCYIGAGIGAISPQEILYKLRNFSLNPKFLKLQQHLERSRTNDLLARHHPKEIALGLAQNFQIHGAKRTFTTACSASAQAIGRAFQDINRGKLDVALVGGADSLGGEILMLGFCLLGVLSGRNDQPQQAARPFDRERSGFVIGEGAAMLVMESLSHAKSRGVVPLAVVEGYGETENAHRITDLPEDGNGAIAAMRNALTSASLQPNQIDCINSHGTATEPNDRIESKAIHEVFGSQTMVTANKAAIGHLIAAAGAIEAVITVKMLQTGMVPPILNFNSTDCTPLAYVTNTRQEAKLRRVVSNSFGFGGTNASIVLSRSDADAGAAP